MILHVTVTAEDVEAAERQNPRRCPLALALARAGVRDPVVTPRSARVRNRYGTVLAILPERVARWAIAWDERQAPPVPFGFAINVPLNVLV